MTTLPSIRVTANRSKRTFTLRKGSSIYRTNKFESQEFHSALMHWTQSDWRQFLKTDEYTVIK